MPTFNRRNGELTSPFGFVSIRVYSWSQSTDTLIHGTARVCRANPVCDDPGGKTPIAEPYHGRTARFSPDRTRNTRPASRVAVQAPGFRQGRVPRNPTAG